MMNRQELERMRFMAALGEALITRRATFCQVNNSAVALVVDFGALPTAAHYAALGKSFAGPLPGGMRIIIKRAGSHIYAVDEQDMLAAGWMRIPPYDKQLAIAGNDIKAGSPVYLRPNTGEPIPTVWGPE